MAELGESEMAELIGGSEMAALGDSEMAELGDVYDKWNAKVKLEELTSKLRDGRLHQPNHADADVLLRAWDDPTVRELVPIITANKVPRQARPITPYIPELALSLILALLYLNKASSQP